MAYKARQMPVTAESRYARAMSAGWLARLLEHGLDPNREFLACLDWSLHGLRPLVQALRAEVEKMLPSGLRSSALRSALEDKGGENAPLSGAAEAAGQLPAPPFGKSRVRDAGRARAKSISASAQIRGDQEKIPVILQELRLVLKNSDDTMLRKLDAVLEEYSGVLLAPFFSLARAACLKGASPQRKPVLFKNGEKHLSHLFGLEQDTFRLCEFVFMLNAFSPVEDYYSDSLGIDRFNSRRLLAHMLGITPGRCRSGINELKRLGILDVDSYALRLEDKIFELWDESSFTKVSRLFCRPLLDPQSEKGQGRKGETLPLSAFPLPPEEVEHVLALLKPRPGRAGEKPVHILLYGPPGTGKTTFARTLARHFKVKAWAVPSRHDDEESGRRSSLNACITLAQRHPGAFVLVDEAERLLDSSIFSNRRSHDKAWINELMEQPGLRLIWVTNHVEHIEQAVRRRFTYSLQFENPGLAERRLLWGQILERHGVSGCLEEAVFNDLMRNFSPPVAVINEAVEQARLLAGKKPAAFSQAVRRVIVAHDTLRRDGNKRRKSRLRDKDFTLEGVSLAKTSRAGSMEELETLLARLRGADAMFRAGRDLGPGAGTLLFHGPPGTGKSALARYIAQELGREYQSRRASELLSPYVGESEQNIAAAFREAEREGALLLVDEADSFIFSRADALRSWEATMVNEFLTALEDYRGFCICTTNRRADMDSAAMRRFAFKVAFDYAGPEQILALYRAMLAPLASAPLSPEESAELSSLKSLTPGDFHAVRARVSLSGAALKPAELLAEIRAELKAKLDRQNRSIGF